MFKQITISDLFPNQDNHKFFIVINVFINIYVVKKRSKLTNNSFDKNCI